MAPDRSYAAEVRAAMPQALPRLAAAARQLTRSEDDAADLVQATCVRAMERAGTLRHRDNLAGWLLRLMRNLHGDRRRRAARQVVPLLAEPVWTPEPVPLWRVVGDDDIARLADRLRPALRLVWTMAHVEQLDHDTIARRLGIPRATVASRVFRARAAVRNGLGDPPAIFPWAGWVPPDHDARGS